MEKLSFSIGSKTVGVDKPVYIIAEAGVNHNGSLQEALYLVDVAIEAGADAVKFQNFKADYLILENVERAIYQKKNTGSVQSQHKMLRELELTFEQNLIIKRYCDEKGIEFLSTPFDEKGLDELVSLNLNAYKISSTDTNNPWLIKKICQIGKPIILSTGMSYMSEVDSAVNIIKSNGNDFCLLQCSTDYPLQDEYVNLNVLKSYSQNYKCILGFSDHSIGSEAAIASISLGVKVIEKHFTRDKMGKGPDHLASLSPAELKSYINSIRRVEKMLGSEIKQPTIGEYLNRKSMQKSIVARKKILNGEIFTEDNLTTIRTGGYGIPAFYIKNIYGMKATQNYEAKEIISYP